MRSGYLDGYSRYEYAQERDLHRHWEKTASSYERKWKELRAHFREKVKSGEIEVDDETAKLIGLKR